MLEDPQKAAKADLSTVAVKLKNHVPYWDEVRMNLNAHVATYGAPSIYLTLNPNMFWEQIRDVYTKVCETIRKSFLSRP